MANLLFAGSDHASLYTKYRPSYPEKLAEVVTKFLRNKKQTNDRFGLALDVGCGSGQSTHLFADHFTHVIGIDVSEAQITEAKRHNGQENVQFRVSSAENLPADDASVDLVTVGQALHWFDLNKFYAEVDRVLKPGGVLAAFTDSNPTIHFCDCSDELNKAIEEKFYSVLRESGCWNDGLLHVEDGYDQFTLPYKERVRDTSVEISLDQSIDSYIGFLSSWSPYQTYLKKHPDDSNILKRIKESLLSIARKQAPDEKIVFRIQHDITILMGRKPGS